MNQFKRAKQLRAESGQSIESITDLKTAGVAVKAETEKNPKENDSIHNVIQEEIQVETHENLPANDRTFTNNNKSSSDQSNEIIIEETINTNKKVEPSQNITETEKNVQKEPVIEESAIAEPVHIEQHENTIIPQENNLPSEAIVTTAPVVHAVDETASQISVEVQNKTEASVVPSVAPVNEVPSVEAPPVETSPVPISNEAINVPTPATVISEPVQTTPQQVQPQYQQYIEPVVSKPSKSTRKSAPNIFAPKGEAKSMRKSLVLKPTSVKIAENYCAKNGGSFNELIQTLLDNFIDEYGL